MSKFQAKVQIIPGRPEPYLVDADRGLRLMQLGYELVLPDESLDQYSVVVVRGGQKHTNVGPAFVIRPDDEIILTFTGRSQPSPVLRPDEVTKLIATVSSVFRIGVSAAADIVTGLHDLIRREVGRLDK